jgi:hypothetical protein
MSFLYDLLTGSKRIEPHAQTELSLIDEGLCGVSGARTALKAIRPSVRKLSLSHNELEDEGVRLLCEGLATLRQSGQHPGLLELSLGELLLA